PKQKAKEQIEQLARAAAITRSSSTAAVRLPAAHARERSECPPERDRPERRAQSAEGRRKPSWVLRSALCALPSDPPHSLSNLGAFASSSTSSSNRGRYVSSNAA